MKKIYRTYKIKKGDTLISIADNNDLVLKELMNYHNERVEIHEQIENRIPSFLSEIILPPEGYSLINGREVWLKKDIPEPNILTNDFFGKLDIDLPTNDVTYGVLKVIKSANKENTIKYKLNIRFYPNNELETYNYISIDLVSKTFINDEEPDLIVDQMAISCMETVYPLMLKVDKNLNLLDIHNHENVLKRWKKQKEKKLKYFQGEVAQKYFDLFEQTISTKELFFNFLNNDWFYKAYFNNIYCVYNDKFELDNITNYPLLPNTKNVQYTIDKKANVLIKENRIKIQIEGVCSDPRNKTELEERAYFPYSIGDKKHKQVEGKYKAVYFLNSKDHRIQSMFLSCDLDLDKAKLGTISISEIEEDSEMQSPQHAKFVGEQEGREKKKDKKTFWKSLFS